MRFFDRIPRPSKSWAAPAAWIGSLTIFAAGWFTSVSAVFWMCVVLGSAFPVYRVTRSLAPKAWPAFRRGLSMTWRWTKACPGFAYGVLVSIFKAPATVAHKIRGKRTTEQSPRVKLANSQKPPVPKRGERRGKRFKALVVVMVLIAGLGGFFFPPLVTGAAAVAVLLFVIWFTGWVIKENRGQLKVFSIRHLLMSSIRFPFYAFPGVMLFALAAFPLLFVDATVGFIINTLASAVGQAGGAVEDYLQNAPSPWDLPRYIPWAMTKWVVPPTAVTDGSVFLSGLVNWIITLSTLLTLITFAAMIIAMIRFLIEIWCRCLLASQGAEVSFRLDEDGKSSRPVAHRFQATSSVREVVSLPRGTGFYSTTKLRPHGPKGYGTMPYIFTCPIARFRWALYRLRCYRAVAKDESLTYTGGAGAHFIQVNVSVGERLCVDLAHLVGFSDTVRLKVRWTSRLSAMLIGRIGYVIASGPGIIVMKATGPPEVLKDVQPTAETRQHFDATCLIAWEPSSQFALGASGKLLDVYLEPAFLYVQTSPLTLLNPGDSQYSGIFAKLKSWFIQSVVPV